MIKYAVCFFLCLPVYAQPIGAINPNVTQDNIKQTICVPGWSAKVRPPVSYTNRYKAELIAKQGFGKMADYELDHILPIGIAGSPTNKQNLWLQPWEGKCGAKVKDVQERLYHNYVCSGRITLQQAQKHFMPWVCK